MYIIGSHIITPLGEGLQSNYDAILQSEKTCSNQHIDIPDSDFCRFEQLCISCAEKAIKESGIDPADSNTLFIISTTKGDIEALQQRSDISTISPAFSAKRISQQFGNRNTPIVVSNACTSGVCAQITAFRLLQAGYYQNIVVIGADVLSDFIISGFNCLKAVSDEPCRPYDADRKGLNLGEAVACMIISNKPHKDCVQLIEGSICNDANHISGPSRTGEGSLRVLQAVTANINAGDIAAINAHGTSTIYNDEMESIAISRAGLSDIPVNSLKSVFGHTMGAAGVLESLLSLYALKKRTILPTHNFSRIGVSGNIRVSNQAQYSDKQLLVKLLSGFGGCNAAMLYSLVPQQTKRLDIPMIKDVARVILSSDNDDINAIYRERINNYPKFLKMDVLSRLGFVAAELISRQVPLNNDCAVIVFSRSGSLANDIRYQQTISDFPSPALFVYTLPNIVTGEIAIRHHLLTETSCYLLPDADWNMIDKIVRTTVAATQCSQVMYGWLEAEENTFIADMKLAIYKK